MYNILFCITLYTVNIKSKLKIDSSNACDISSKEGGKMMINILGRLRIEIR